MDRESETILHRKKKVVKISDQEILLLLRSYMEFPCSWGEIINSIKDNLHTLPADAQTLFKSASVKQLKERLSTKLGKLTTKPLNEIKNEDVRVELMKVKELESRCKDKKEVDKSDACIENSEQKGGREGILEAQTSSEEGATKTDEGHAHEAGSSVAEGSTSKRKDNENSEEVDVPKKKEKTFYSTINEKKSNGIQQVYY